MWGGWPRGSEFLQLSPLGSIIAGAARAFRLRLGYSHGSFRSPVSRFHVKTLETGNRKLETCFTHQLPASEKFTMIWVSTSTGSLFKK